MRLHPDIFLAWEGTSLVEFRMSVNPSVMQDRHKYDSMYLLHINILVYLLETKAISKYLVVVPTWLIHKYYVESNFKNAKLF